MATLNGNNAYLSFNGINVSGYFTDEIAHSASNSSVDITAGAGATHVERAAGLSDNTMDFVLVYDTADLPTYRTALVEGTIADVIWGPEGNVSGKPKFQCSMLLTEAKVTQQITKERVAFEVSFEGAAAPTATITGGSTF